MLCLCLLEEIIGEEEFVLLSEVHRPSNLPFPHSAYERNKSKIATVNETRRACRRLLHSLFAVVARDLLASLARRCFHFISLVHLKKSSNKSKSLHLCDLKCRQKLRPMILDCSFFKFRGICPHLI